MGRQTEAVTDHEHHPGLTVSPGTTGLLGPPTSRPYNAAMVWGTGSVNPGGLGDENVQGRGEPIELIGTHLRLTGTRSPWAGSVG